MIRILLHTAHAIFRHPLNRNHAFAALRRYLAWQIGSRLVPGDVAVPFADDTLLLVSPGMTGATLNIYTGLCEFPDMALVLHLLRPGDLFIDVGANVGAYTILAAGAAGANVIAAEPIARTFDRLSMNIQLNRLNGRVTAHMAGVGSCEGKLKFSVAHDTRNHVVLETQPDEACIEVPVTTLDVLVGGQNPVLIKIDVEGFEAEVIKGGAKTLQNKSLRGLIIELNGSGAHYGYDDNSIHQTLTEYGFRPYAYSPHDRKLTELAAPNDGANTLYLRDVAEVEARVVSAPKHRVQERLI